MSSLICSVFAWFSLSLSLAGWIYSPSNLIKFEFSGLRLHNNVYVIVHFGKCNFPSGFKCESNTELICVTRDWVCCTADYVLYVFMLSVIQRMLFLGYAGMVGIMKCKRRPVGTWGLKAKLWNQRGEVSKSFLSCSVHIIWFDVLICRHKGVAWWADGLEDDEKWFSVSICNFTLLWFSYNSDGLDRH